MKNKSENKLKMNLQPKSGNANVYRYQMSADDDTRLSVVDNEEKRICYAYLRNANHKGWHIELSGRFNFTGVPLFLSRGTYEDLCEIPDEN